MSETQRRRLLRATIAHAPFDGWSAAAFAAAAADCGFGPGDAARLFPGGLAELLDFYHREADAGMAAALASSDLKGLRHRDKVALAIRLRLEPLAGEREAIRRALGFLALPSQTGLAFKLAARTVDAIWHALGDRSTDFGWYSKRALLGAVYGTTFLHWLDDKSLDSAATWAFLERRLDEVMGLPKLTGRIEARLTGAKRLLPDPLRFWRRLTARR